MEDEVDMRMIESEESEKESSLRKQQEKKDLKDYNKRISKTIGDIVVRRSKWRHDTYIPALDTGDFIYARRHNKTTKEILCQNLIKKEKMRYFSKRFEQKRLDRNYKKYAKTGKQKYKKKIKYYGAYIENKQQYLKSLDDISRIMENKSIKEYLNLKGKKLNLRRAKDGSDCTLQKNNINVRNTIYTILKRRVRRNMLHRPISTLAKITACIATAPILILKNKIRAHYYGKTYAEIYCQDLIRKEQRHYLYKGIGYNQKRLERNCKKYRKTGKDKYKKRMMQHGRLFDDRREYLDLLNNTLKSINNKSYKAYKKIKSTKNSYIKKIKKNSSKDKIANKHQNVSNTKLNQYQKDTNTISSNSTNKTDSVNNGEKLKNNLNEANNEFDKNNKNLTSSSQILSC